jgi:hypothetical protein
MTPTPDVDDRRHDRRPIDQRSQECQLDVARKADQRVMLLEKLLVV